MVYSWKVLLVLLVVIAITSNQVVNANVQTIQSPLKQLEAGIKIQDVKCKEELVLVIKESTSQPSCVKPTSEQRLLAHGWIIPKFETTQITNNNNSKSVIVHENTTPSNTVNQNQTYYPVYQSHRYATVKVSDLPPISEIPPIPAVSTTPLTQITEPTTINYSNPNATKILFVGMSPNPLKVGDIPRFTVTYQNTSGKPLYGFNGGGWNLSKVVSSSNVQAIHRYDLPTWSQGSEVIEPNQIITEEAGSYDYYKIIQSGLVHVTLTLKLSNSPYYHGINIDTIQFDVNATQ